MKIINLIIADDHPVVVEGIKLLLEKFAPFANIVGIANDGKELLEKIDKLKPDLAIIDLSMPELDGIDAIKRIKRYHPEIKIIVLTMRDELSYIKSAEKSGADGYVIKSVDSHELLSAIEKVNSGEKYYCSKTKEILSNHISIENISLSDKSKSDYYLTPRELEIIKLITKGFTSQQIAERLGISYFTVSQHRKNILSKLGLKSVVELTKFAIDNKLID